MARPVKPKHVYEFGSYRFDSSIPVLLRDGDIVPLTPKALDTLLALLENAGNVVSKEALLQAVWPSAFVEESNLAQHISALRKTLGDGDIQIETVAKRGYRLIGSVAEIAGNGAPSGSEKPALEGDSPGPSVVRGRGLVWAGAAVACLAVLGLVGRFNWAPTHEAPQWKQRQLTANTEQDPVLRSAISPDGKYLAYSDQAGIHALVTATGESRLLRSPENLCFR